jgi:hypothetical protein
LVYRQQHLAAHPCGGCQQEVKSAPHRPVGAVLHRHDAESHLPRLDLTKYFVDGCAGHALHRAAETLERGFFAERPARAEKGHGHGLLERTAGGDDFGEQAVHGIGRQRAGVTVLQPPQHLGFALGPVHGPVALQAANTPSQIGALVHQLEELVVDGVDTVAQGADLVAHARTQAGR